MQIDENCYDIHKLHKINKYKNIAQKNLRETQAAAATQRTLGNCQAKKNIYFGLGT